MNNPSMSCPVGLSARKIYGCSGQPAYTLPGNGKRCQVAGTGHVLTAELIERLIERIEIDHERNIHVMFRFKNEFQGKGGGTMHKNM